MYEYSMSAGKLKGCLLPRFCLYGFNLDKISEITRGKLNHTRAAFAKRFMIFLIREIIFLETEINKASKITRNWNCESPFPLNLLHMKY